MAVNLDLSEEKMEFSNGVNLLYHPLRLAVAGNLLLFTFLK